MSYDHLLTYIVFLFLWMASPGPCFAMVARNATKYGIKGGIWTAIGMVICDSIFIFFAVIGVAEFLSLYPKVLSAGKMIGAAYIFYIGIEILLSTFRRSAQSETCDINTEATPVKLMVRGFLTDASNPLLIIGMLAIVLRFIDPSAGVGVITLYSVLLPITTIYVTFGIAVIFGNTITRRLVVPYMHWFERLAGVLIAFLAILMIIE